MFGRLKRKVLYTINEKMSSKFSSCKGGGGGGERKNLINFFFKYVLIHIHTHIENKRKHFD